MFGRRHTLFASTALASLALVAAACGGSGGGSANASPSHATTKSQSPATVAVASALTACGGGDPLASGSEGGGDSIVVGSANFPESELLMEMYSQALEAEGVTVETKPNIGSREVYMEAFKSGDIDLLPEYNGGLLLYLTDGNLPENVSAPDDVYAALQKSLPKGSQTLPQSAAVKPSR